MNKSILLGATGIAVAFGMLAFGYTAGNVQPARAVEAPQTVATPAPVDKGEVEKIVRDYLVANPEILDEMQAALDAKRTEQQRIAQIETIRANKDEIFNSKHDAVVGNPNGTITIVEFYDYNCGFCKRALDDMKALTDADPELRFVLKEFPILGPDSQKAHMVASAFQRLMPEKYEEFHQKLLGHEGRAGEESAMKLALSLGADEARLRAELENPEIVENFSRTYDLASKLAITGTPSYVVGNEVVFGALGRDVLSERIAAARD
ncbi:DsbA family protein [Arvimicrobium flavum]|uniref:DsbA family protein n=1 Tax=Arvimicrobium flavum TaxID=3393320 RepID=UPI00237B67DD|nr:DsbA family protein [Mesorhizobium shangrilense]